MPPDPHFARRSGAEGTNARWLLGGERGETAAGGVVGVLELEPGATIPLHRHPLEESALYVLDGSATIATASGTAAAPAGAVLHVPVGAWYGLGTHAPRGCRLLLVFATAPDAAAIVWERPTAGHGPDRGPPATLLQMPLVDEVEMHDPADGRHHVRARWLLDAEHHGAAHLIVGQCSFGPGSLHELHRHPGAAEALFAYEGVGTHLGEHGVEEQGPGELVYVPAGEWHGLRGPRIGTMRSLFLLFGVATFDDVGYELHRGRR